MVLSLQEATLLCSPLGGLLYAGRCLEKAVSHLYRVKMMTSRQELVPLCRKQIVSHLTHFCTLIE